MSEDFNAQVGRLDERMKGMEGKIDTLTEQVELLRKEREVKWWPIILGVVAVAGFIGGIGAGWVNLRLEPIKIQQAQGQKDFDRLYDDVRTIQKQLDSKADSKSVEDRIGYAYDRLKTEIQLKKQTP